MNGHTDIYGDGRAAERVFEALSRWCRGLCPLLTGDVEFRPASRDNTIATG
jgi:hypothetical protein